MTATTTRADLPSLSISGALSIGEVAARTGLTKDTLRWYESEGLLPDVHRNRNGYRAYDERTVRMIELVLRLRRTGMPVVRMRDFIALVAEGAASHGQRMMLLTEHRERILDQIAQLREDLVAIDAKAEHYSQLISQGLDCDGAPVTDPTTITRQRSHR
ncbi:MerR family transcriptional regulator [Janibacter sp. Soil728]|uniref:MerR family transcriptional regulator n=1 Tax=Janibacter sp. Soil728 TaxID=1736393 RepID=UPI0006F38B0E|nr:MerR family transcriptional regulator [Janibacter sp. Soil728]KRE39200.1 MerR family transcriptional regulator [Janibacter sp. Soil728]